MKLKVLGTQSPYNTEGHNCPGFFIQDGNNRILLDCGSGSHSLLSYPCDLENLSVFISHLHRDHYNDIFNLQYSSFVFHNQKRLQRPIDIYLPSTPSDIVNDITGESNSYANYYNINDESRLKVGNIEISFCKMDHPVETYAIRLDNGERSIVYSSDTSFSAKDRLIDFSREADLLICESSLLTEYGFPEINSHLTAKQAGIIAKQANVKGLALTHFWPEEDIHKYVDEAKSVFINVVALKEEQVIDVPTVDRLER